MADTDSDPRTTVAIKELALWRKMLDEADEIYSDYRPEMQHRFAMIPEASALHLMTAELAHLPPVTRDRWHEVLRTLALEVGGTATPIGADVAGVVDLRQARSS